MFFGRGAVGGAILFAATLATAGAGDLAYVGSSTVGKFIVDANAVYAGPKLAVDTKPESAGGESCPARDACGIGGVAREPQAKYLERGVVATLIGKDAIAAIVHHENPVQGLTSDQLAGIFSGAITDWAEVGGAPGTIRPLIVKKSSATRKVFQAEAMSGVEYGELEVVTPDQKIVAEVARDPLAIGQISFAFIQGNERVLPLDVDGEQADVTNSTYPITRPLYLTTMGAPSGAAKDFIDWALSDAGQAVVTRRFIAAN